MGGSANGAAVSIATPTPVGSVDVIMGGTSTTSSTTTTTTTTTTTAAAAAAAAAAAVAAAASIPTTIVSASLLATVGSGGSSSSSNSSSSANGLIIDRGLEPRARCSQCGRRRTACHHLPHQQGLQQPTSSSLSTSANSIIANGALNAARPRRVSKLRHRALTATTTSTSPTDAPTIPENTTNSHASVAFSNFHAQHQPASDPSDTSSAAMEPPVLSFYGKEPVPLPSRFAHIKRSLVEGHEAELEASWARLLAALRDDMDDIASRGSGLTPSIDFNDMQNPAARAAFSRDLKRYGLGVVRGVVPRADAQVAIDETVKYLEKQTDFKEPPPQDPTCFDFFWTPAQVRTRAHPRVLEAQRFVMSLWDNNADDRMAIRFPIAYGDRLRIHGANIGGVGPDAKGTKAHDETAAAADSSPNGNGEPADDDDVFEARRAAAELLGDFTSSTVIAQVDNGSLERWEPDGYGRGGTYDAVFKGEWEKYDPWDPTYRVSATPDLYNGYGSCSIFRMYQGVVALSTIEPGLIRLLPSPKLATAYFLLRPFFSPKTKPPAAAARGRDASPEWQSFLDPSNWSLDRDQSTIIHGAVPGHAQRLTELWHPHLHLRRTLVTIPTLQTGDYIVWHPDLAYHITSNPNLMASRAPTPPPEDHDGPSSSTGRPVSILVYVPAAPLTQTNALYLARQRKTFQRGHPGPDFDSTGSGLGSEATHIGRPTETDIAGVGGPAGLQAMGLAPFDVAPTPPTPGTEVEGVVKKEGGEGVGGVNGAEGKEKKKDAGGDVEMDGEAVGSASGGVSGPSMTRAEAEVARLANIILFPDRYDFYMAKRNGNGSKRSKVRVERRNADGKALPEFGDKGKGKEASAS